jgi:hypothetical protein
MFKRLIPVCVVLVIAAPLLAQTTVTHVTGYVTGWRGGNNHSANYCKIDAWPNNGSWGGYQDATLAVFDRATLQTAINGTINTYGGWDAKVLVTQPDWASQVDPKTALPNLGPVAGSAQVDPATIDWAGLTATSFTAGIGSWALGGTNYSTFGAAVLAGVPTGKSVVYDTINWTTESRPTGSGTVWWDVVMDPPEDLLVQYIKNTSATGLFASAKTAYDATLNVYQNQNLGSDIRVRIDAPPPGVPWMNAVIAGDPHTLWVSRTIIQGAGTVNVSVQVNNATTGTLAWTAAESPDATWLSLTSASGGNGATFQMTLDATGIAVGTYSTAVVITDNGSGNKTVTIPVTLTVQSASPVIQLVPASLTFQASPTGPNPASQSVTVNNSGSGTLSWTAAENPNVAWLSITPPGTGGNGGTFQVNVDKTGLTAGAYTATIRVTDSGASNSPQDLPVTLNLQDQDANIATANSYDAAWQDGPNGWAGAMWHMQLNAAGKTAGFITLLGDSITYANPFSQWPRYGSGKTTADTTICNWMHAANWGSGSNNSDNGWYLAAWDVPSRNGSFTARSGITSGQYLAGAAPPGLPSVDQMFTAGFTNPDGKQYRDALMAVILLGTNDIGGGNTAALTANLGSIIDKLVAAKVIPILTTLPPRTGADTTVGNFNTAIRNLAQTRAIPLIDFWAEIMRRRPGTTWQNTLISSDGVHPSSTGGVYNSSSDPYVNSGEPLSNVGYLLRSWLTVQKIAEVKAAVLDRRLGDANGDTHVDAADVLLVAASFGKASGQPGYDQRCDFNGDNKVDVSDLLKMAPNFGT